MKTNSIGGQPRALLPPSAWFHQTQPKRPDVEPLLRRLADHEIQATIPLNEAVTAILHLFDA
jgi:hypothetical protein